jgi:vacuolar-type H+-ATPase subunit F/Vma7
MHDIIFIGDALTAAGFRLAGVETRVPASAALAGAVDTARGQCRVLVMTTALHATLPPPLARALELGDAPLLALVPDVQAQVPVADLEVEARRALGIEV